MAVERTAKDILPWLVPLLASLAVITCFPQLVLWLPRMFY
jgi:TRAP-type C4-dicarboxylate transport system permease large subunit